MTSVIFPEDYVVSLSTIDRPAQKVEFIPLHLRQAELRIMKIPITLNQNGCRMIYSFHSNTSEDVSSHNERAQSTDLMQQSPMTATAHTHMTPKKATKKGLRNPTITLQFQKVQTSISTSMSNHGKDCVELVGPLYPVQCYVANTQSKLQLNIVRPDYVTLPEIPFNIYVQPLKTGEKNLIGHKNSKDGVFESLVLLPGEYMFYSPTCEFAIFAYMNDTYANPLLQLLPPYVSFAAENGNRHITYRINTKIDEAKMLLNQCRNVFRSIDITHHHNEPEQVLLQAIDRYLEHPRSSIDLLSNDSTNHSVAQLSVKPPIPNEMCKQRLTIQSDHTSPDSMSFIQTQFNCHSPTPLLNNSIQIQHLDESLFCVSHSSFEATRHEQTDFF